MRIFVSGGTGVVGKRLIDRLQKRGDSVVLLTRRPALAREHFGGECTVVEGDAMHAGAWANALADCDAVINLSGEGIFNRRWNNEFKKLLWDSRIKSTENIAAALARASDVSGPGPRALINASAIGYYGPHGDEELTEEDPPGNDEMARLCVAWEKAARQAESPGTRVVSVRIGVVLDKEGGALPQMLKPFKMLGVGGPTGSGKQWVSWIHHTDLTGILLLALDNANAAGPVNATAPNPVTNKDLAKAQGRALHRPAFLPAPAIGLRIALGQVAQVVTTGQRVLPKRATALGYQFCFPTIDAALSEILG